MMLIQNLHKKIYKNIKKSKLKTKKVYEYFSLR